MGSYRMDSNLVLIPLLIALSLLSGCSYFSNNTPVQENANTPPPIHLLPPPAPKPLESKATSVLCDEVCSTYKGIKKKFCLKKCEFKKKRADRKALIAECEAKESSLWSRLLQKKRNILYIDCLDL